MRQGNRQRRVLEGRSFWRERMREMERKRKIFRKRKRKRKGDEQKGKEKL